MYFKQIISTKKTVFNISDLRQIWQIQNKNYLKIIINRLFKRGEIIRLKRGIYAINSDYNVFELSNKIKKTSYVSLETVLVKNGVIFQDYSKSIYAVSDNTVNFIINDIKYYYFKLADAILLNPLGIENKNTFSIASVERAIADKIYLTPNYYFDNLRNVDVKKLKKISEIYNKRTREEIKKIIRFIQKNYA